MSSIYELVDDLGLIRAGFYAVIEVGPTITLSRLGVNADGNLCTTHHLLNATWEEMEEFEKTGTLADPLGEAPETE